MDGEIWKGATTAMSSRRDALIDGTTGRLGWSNRAQGLYRSALGAIAIVIGVAALIWHPSPLAAAAGAVLAAGGLSLILVYVRARRQAL